MREGDVDRKCIVTGEVRDKEELLRFTVIENGEVFPDFKKKLPGKGVYVTNSKSVLFKAIEKDLFSKALKKKTKTGNELVELVEGALRKKGLESVNLARKAGVLLTGFDKVTDALKKEKVAFLLEAGDAKADGAKRIANLAKNVEVFYLYNTEELDKALDKVNTVHVAFLKSSIAKMVYDDFKRLLTFLSNGNTETKE